MSANISQDNKRIAKNTFYLYIRMIVLLAIGLYTSRAILDALGVEDFGIYNVVGGFVALLSLFTIALTSAAQRFITYELGSGDFERLKKTFYTFSTILFIFGIVVVILGFISGDLIITKFLNIPVSRIKVAINVFYLSTFAFSIKILTTPYLASIIAHEHMNYYALVSIGESILKLLIVFLLYYTCFDRLEIYAIFIVVVGLVELLSYGVYCSIKFEETKLKLAIDKSILKEIYSFSIWVVFGGSAMVAKEQGVNMLINLFFGVTLNAARGISVQISNVLNQFASNIANAINPQITKCYAAGDLQRSIRLTFLLTKAQGIMLLIISLPLYVEIEYVLNLWLKNVPYYAEVFARWSIIIVFVSTLRQTYGSLYLATGKVRFLEIVGGGIILLNLPVSYIALYYGAEPVSTMMINVMLEVMCMLACFGYMKFILNFPILKFFTATIFPLVVVTTISYSCTAFLKSMYDDGFVRLLLVIISATIITCLLSYLLVLSSQEKVFFREVVINRLIKR